MCVQKSCMRCKELKRRKFNKTKIYTLVIKICNLVKLVNKNCKKKMLTTEISLHLLLFFKLAILLCLKYRLK